MAAKQAVLQLALVAGAGMAPAQEAAALGRLAAWEAQVGSSCHPYPPSCGSCRCPGAWPSRSHTHRPGWRPWHLLRRSRGPQRHPLQVQALSATAACTQLACTQLACTQCMHAHCQLAWCCLAWLAAGAAATAAAGCCRCCCWHCPMWPCAVHSKVHYFSSRLQINGLAPS